VRFRIISPIAEVEKVAEGRGIRILSYLNKTYGKGRWRKLKGVATIELEDGTVLDAEVHWFEAHGIGRRDFKIKRYLR
jgi:hypothetical protein